MTVDEDAPMWRDCQRLPEDMLAFGFSEGAILRFRPPAGLRDSVVEVARRASLRGGAAAVRVEWPPKEMVVPEQQRVLATANEGVRAVVLWMVERANTRDREALKSAVEAALAAAGL